MNPLEKSLTDQLKDLAASSAANLLQCIQNANEATRLVLSQSPEDLEAWLNGMASELKTIFTRHFVEGTAYNTAAASAGIPQRVDVRPFAEKAAKRGLAVSFDETGWHVTPIPQPGPTE